MTTNIKQKRYLRYEVNTVLSHILTKTTSPLLTLLRNNSNKDSSESSLDDDPYLDEQEDPMTDQQVQNNQTSEAAGAGNTLPIKSNGNAARSVKIFSCLGMLLHDWEA